MLMFVRIKINKYCLSVLFSCFFSSCGYANTSFDDFETLLPEYARVRENCIASLSNLSFKQRMKEFYNLEKNGDVEFISIHYGVANPVFFVKYKNTIVGVLKCFSETKTQEVTKIVNITEELRKKGVVTPKTNFIFSVPEHHSFLVLMRYCFGDHNGAQNEEKRIKKMAQAIANLHRFQAPSRVFYHFTKKRFEALFEQCKGWGHALEIKEIFEKINLDYLDKIPLGLTHGDLSPTNILFDNNDNITCILDFDHIGSSYLLTDLVRTQMYFGFNEEGRLQEDKVAMFLEAYNLHRPLLKEEFLNFYNHLKLMLIYVALNAYNNAYIRRVLNPDRFSYSRLNNAVNPEVVFYKLLQIEHKKSICDFDIENSFSIELCAEHINDPYTCKNKIGSHRF